MFMRDCTVFVAASMIAGAATAQDYGLGKKATEKEIAGWNIDIAPDGKGLPAGSGSVAHGQQVYAQKCAACHGAKGEGKPADQLVGGADSLKTTKPVRTVGSFWPYATTVYDYIYRSMPYTNPQSLSTQETYAVTAYLLHLNGIVGADAVMNAASLPKVQMPNRAGFIVYSGADTANNACTVECK